jgi:hypothetical protein
MLAYVVILMAVLYLVLHFGGVFDDIAAMFDRMGKGRRGSARRPRSSPGKDDLSQRLQVFEDFFGKTEEEDGEGE